MRLNSDKLAMFMSLACAVHCFAVPVLIMLLPSLSFLKVTQSESAHLWMLAAVLPTSVLALFRGCRVHDHKSCAFYGCVGLVILTLSAIWGHQLLGCRWERYLTLLGSSLMAYAHLRNHLLCARIAHPHSYS